MDWSRYLGIDPHLLVGLVNTELRNHAESLEDLCQTHDIDREKLCTHLESANYYFYAEQKQFR